MAVTTTFALIDFATIDQQFGTVNSDAASISGTGGFVGIGDHVGHIDGDIFDRAGNDDDGFTSLTGTVGAVAQLANGNLVIASQDADSILFKIVDSTLGNTVVATTDFADIDSTDADVAGLTGGRFVVVNEDELGAIGGDADIDVRIREADGTAVTAFTVDAGLDRDTNACVTALDNGNFAVAWQRDNGATTEIWYAVYNSAGGVVKAVTLADTTGTINRDPAIVATAGGFAIGYEDNGWGGDTEITLARFTNAGTFTGFTQATDNFVADSHASLTRLTNGMIGLTDSAAFGDNDIILQIFNAGAGGSLAQTTLTAGESIFDEQDFSSLAGVGQGRIGAFWTNVTDGDIDGELIQGRRTSISDGAGDAMVGDDFIDLMTGNGGDDSMFGGDNNDTINGNDGDDIIRGGQGVDLTQGGNQNDTFIFDVGDAPAGEVINGQAGTDIIRAIGNVIFRGATITSIEEIEFTSAGPNFAQLDGAHAGGSGLSNFLLVDGDLGDTDQIRFDMGTDTAINLSTWVFTDWTQGGPDNDTVRIFGDGDNENLRGSSVRDFIEGDGGTNIINGDLGNDQLSGGVLGGGNIDRFIFNTTLGPANVDRITDFEINIDECRLENTIFTGLVNGNLNVNAFVIGASAADASDRIVYNAANGALFFDQDGLGGVAQVRFATLDAGLALDNLDFIVT